MEHYLFLSSNDSLNYHKSNHWADFTVELNQDFLLQGEWEIALLDFTCDVTNSGHVTIFCDLCCPSWMNGHYLPVLRSFYASDGHFTSNFTFPYYIGLHSSSFKRLRLYILRERGSSVSFTDEPLRCTLHLKRQR